MAFDSSCRIVTEVTVVEVAPVHVIVVPVQETRGARKLAPAAPAPGMRTYSFAVKVEHDPTVVELEPLLMLEDVVVVPP